MLKDAATLVIGSGNYFTAAVGTALPTDLLNPGVEWENVGHTSIEDIFSIASDGGDATTIGTLQAAALRTKYAPRTETFNFTLQQFDEDSLKLYFGANAPTTEDGLIGIPASNPQPTQRAFLAVFVDGSHVFAFYAPKAELFRADDMSLSDTESLAGLPIGVKPLTYGSNIYGYAVTPLAATAQTAVAGAPGSYEPQWAAEPDNLAAMATVTASPTSAWTTGQYVNLADGTTAYWDGAAWAAGKAA